jgi:hypothetical protein
MVDCVSEYFSMIYMECGYNLEEKLEEYKDAYTYSGTTLIL